MPTKKSLRTRKGEKNFLLDERYFESIFSYAKRTALANGASRLIFVLELADRARREFFIRVRQNTLADISKYYGPTPKLALEIAVYRSG